MPEKRDISLRVIDHTRATNCPTIASGCGERIAGFPLTALRAAAGRHDLLAAMGGFYSETDRLIAAQSPTCWNKGQCCDFTRLGSRLFVTALEVCYYLAGHRPPPVAGDACPHAYDGSCHARDHRPLGCRIYYCDPSASHWQSELMEERLRQLRGLHTKLGIPYFYADWIRVLRSLGG